LNALKVKNVQDETFSEIEERTVSEYQLKNVKQDYVLYKAGISFGTR